MSQSILSHQDSISLLLQWFPKLRANSYNTIVTREPITRGGWASVWRQRPLWKQICNVSDWLGRILRLQITWYMNVPWQKFIEVMHSWVPDERYYQWVTSERTAIPVWPSREQLGARCQSAYHCEQHLKEKWNVTWIWNEWSRVSMYCIWPAMIGIWLILTIFILIF